MVGIMLQSDARHQSSKVIDQVGNSLPMVFVCALMISNYLFMSHMLTPTPPTNINLSRALFSQNKFFDIIHSLRQMV